MIRRFASPVVVALVPLLATNAAASMRVVALMPVTGDGTESQADDEALAAAIHKLARAALPADNYKLLRTDVVEAELASKRIDTVRCDGDCAAAGAQALGAGLAVSGTIDQTSTGVRLAMQLIQSWTGQQLGHVEVDAASISGLADAVGHADPAALAGTLWAFQVEVHFVPGIGYGRWTLVGPNDALICPLECTRRVSRDTSYHLEWVSNSGDGLTQLSLPEWIPASLGPKVLAVAHEPADYLVARRVFGFTGAGLIFVGSLLWISAFPPVLAEAFVGAIFGGPPNASPVYQLQAGLAVTGVGVGLGVVAIILYAISHDAHVDLSADLSKGVTVKF